MLCGASAVIQVEDRTSDYADRGTRLHGLAHQRLLGEIPDGLVYGELASETASVEAYVDYVRSRSGTKLYEIHGMFVDNCGGQSDCVVFDWTARTLEIIDYKAGEGVRVDAQFNYQLAIYALAVLRRFSSIIEGAFDTVKLTIVQPAFGVDSWDIELWSLEKNYGEEIALRVQAIQDGEAEFFATPKACQFCNAKPICPELAKAGIEAAKEAFAGLEDDDKANTPEVRAALEVDLDGLGRSLTLAPLARMWAKSVEDEGREVLLSGQPVTGFKLVAGRGSRSFDDRKVAKTLLELWGFSEMEIYPDPVMVSPAQAEKLVKESKAKDSGVFDWTARKNELLELVVKTPGRPVVAFETDKRKAIDTVADAKRAFADVEESEE